MIVIVDYGERPEYLLYQLEKLGLPLKFTSVESEILAADRIILPDSKDLKRAVKRLHLLNLFSMLRMVKKPVLGIGNGFALMCEGTPVVNCEGLGFFPLSVTTPVTAPPLPAKYEATVKENSIYLDGEIFEGLYFEKFFTVSSDVFNVLCLSGDTTLPAACVNGRYGGLIFNPEFSGPAGNYLLNRFLTL